MEYVILINISYIFHLSFRPQVGKTNAILKVAETDFFKNPYNSK